MTLGCGKADPSMPKVPDLRIAGSETLADSLLPALLKEYQASDPDLSDLSVKIEPGGTAQGIRSLIAAQVDLAAASRTQNPAEQDQAKAHGFSLRSSESRHLVAVNVVSLMVQTENAVEALTYDQVIGIFCTGTINDWSQLGLAPQPLHAIGREPSSGSRAVFEDFFCGPKGLHRSVQIFSVAQTQKLMAEDRGSITFGSLAEVQQKTVALRADAQYESVLPSPSNVISGAYPLYNDLYLYTRGRPSGAAADFLSWIESAAGQAVVEKERFVPLNLRPAAMDGKRPLRETMHFEPNSSRLDPRSHARLDILATDLQQRTGEDRHVVLEGFSDNEEPQPLELSRVRAEAVATILRERLPGLFFEIIPRGNTAPIAPNATPFGRSQNRRIQVYLEDEHHEDEELSERAPSVPTTP